VPLLKPAAGWDPNAEAFPPNSPGAVLVVLFWPNNPPVAGVEVPKPEVPNPGVDAETFYIICFVLHTGVYT